MQITPSTHLNPRNGLLSQCTTPLLFPIIHSSMNDIAKMSISHTTFLLKVFQKCPCHSGNKIQTPGHGRQALSELNRTSCSVNNIELLQPHISQFSCCSSLHSWPDPTLAFGHWLSLCQDALPGTIREAVCSPTTQVHTAKCWPPLVG